jgi:lipopolysaccharide/colanic/teichoic acid biosynthesis glycosyltransferase
LPLDEDELIQGFYRSRHDLRPGITGHWQVLGSWRVPLEDMVTLDYLYVANWSLWADIRLLWGTVPYLLSRRGV